MALVRAPLFRLQIRFFALRIAHKSKLILYAYRYDGHSSAMKLFPLNEYSKHLKERKIKHFKEGITLYFLSSEMFEISKQLKRIFYSLLVLSDGPVSIKNNIRSLSFHKYKKNKCSGCCHNIQIKLSFLILKALLWKGPEFIFIELKIFF